MSRWEQAKNIVASVLNGRESELTLKSESDEKARVFFYCAYWRDEDHIKLIEALLARSFLIETWTIHGGGPELNVELRLLDGLE